jgi:DNA repair and recombination protein RAD54B
MIDNRNMFKPFKQPLLKRIEKPAPASIDLNADIDVDLTISDSDQEREARPQKKRKLLLHVVEDSPPKALPISKAVNAPRKPLLTVKNPIESRQPSSNTSDFLEGYYNVLWYVPSTPGNLIHETIFDYLQAQIHS